MTFDHAAMIIRDIKTIDETVLTVMGGPHVSMCAHDTLAALPELDMVVMGEGEDTIIELAGEIAGERQWDHVSGIIYRKYFSLVATPPFL